MTGFLDGYDVRTRRVILLVGATALALGGAIWAVTGTAGNAGPSYERQAFFPDLETRLDTATRVEIANLDGTIVVERDADGTWTLPDKDGYPANVRPLRALFEGLRAMEALAPKTKNPAWHEALDLVDPDEDGDAVRIVMTDAAGDTVAAVLVGKEDEAGSVGGRERFHVRRQGEDQTWLVTGRLPRETEADAWLQTDVLAIAREDLHQAALRPAEGPAYTVGRDRPETTDYSLAQIPDGRTARSPFVINGVATAIAGLTIRDVADAVVVGDAAPVAEARYKTFDGLVVDIRQYAAPEGDTDGPWLAFSARAEPPVALPETEVDGDGAPAETEAGAVEGGDAATADATETDTDTGTTVTPAGNPEAISAEVGAAVNRINTLARGRVFRVAPYQAEQLAKPLDELLEPEASAEAP